jgi:hypothetical protein
MEGRSSACGRERAGDLHSEAADGGVLARSSVGAYESRLRVYGEFSRRVIGSIQNIHIFLDDKRD